LKFTKYKFNKIDNRITNPNNSKLTKSKSYKIQETVPDYEFMQ